MTTLDITTIHAARALALRSIERALAACADDIATDAFRYLVDNDHGPGNDRAIDEACSLFADHMLGPGWRYENDGECAVSATGQRAIDLTATPRPRYIDPSCTLGNDGEYRSEEPELIRW